MKAEKDGSASYAALEKKAELYEKLAKGELSDEEEKEKYCVDFFSKSLNRSENEESKVEDKSKMTTNDNNEDDNLSWLNAIGPGRTGSVADHDEHKRFVRYVITCLVIDWYIHMNIFLIPKLYMHVVMLSDNLVCPL